MPEQQEKYGLDDFAYDLPEELIAQEPVPDRSSSRLMVVDRSKGTYEHHKFTDIVDLLRPNDLLVVNDTRVIPARLAAKRETGGAVEILLLRPQAHSPGCWLAMATPLRKLRAGEQLRVEGSDYTVTVKEIVFSDDGQKRLLVDFGSNAAVHTVLTNAGMAPLPPYIKRPDSGSDIKSADLERYQTVYAAAPGAVAAPTAGLHFTAGLFEQLQERGIGTVKLTLHVGPGTFKPITSSLDDHFIEGEDFSISPETAEAINTAKGHGGRVIAVGTTTCRALESAGGSGKVLATAGERTSLYIRHREQFKIVDALVTNFHLSRSSLLVLVSAFAGHDLVMSAYNEAVSRRYRFFSYGDAMLIM